MVKKAVKAEFNTFVKGLITEASPLNFPENSSFEEVNFKLNRDGSRERRLGMDFEEGNIDIPVPSLVTPSTFTNQEYTTFEWNNVGSIPGRTFLVVQLLNRFDFFDLNKIPLSTQGYLGGLNLSSLSSYAKVSMASVDGRLVIANGDGDIVIVSCNGISFSTSSVRLQVRDMWGVEHPQTASDPYLRIPYADDRHRYNLYNQSWAIPRKAVGYPVDYITDPLQLYQSVYSLYPSESESVWPALQLQPTAPPAIPSERIFPNLFAEQTEINIKAAKGHFIIDLLRRGSSRSTAITENSNKYPQMNLKSFSAVSDYTPGGATIVCEFAGRVFYAGFSGSVVDGDSRSPDLSNYISFSQLVRNKEDLGRCYQDGDPTSREGSDVVDTDGGLIRISGADGINHMITLGTSLIVFAKNGVWAITGGSDYGFTATNYKVDRISKFGLISPKSVVEEITKIFYWSIDGIYVIAKDQMSSLGITNITDKTIQTLYENIPSESKSKSIGVYDTIGRTVRWIYFEGERFTNTFIAKELVIDIVLEAFSINKIAKLQSDSSPEILSVFKSNPFQDITEYQAVMVGNETVYADTEAVSYQLVGRTSGLTSTRYLCISSTGGYLTYTFAYYNNVSFRDWEAYDFVGEDAKAYLITGKITAGDSSIHKQVPYLTTHFKRTEQGLDGNFELINPSGCLIRSQWDFTSSAISNKWGPLFQAYRYRQAFIPTSNIETFDNGYDLVTSKSKLRGRGRALSLYMETEPGKDCKIIGWSISLNGNSVT